MTTKLLVNSDTYIAQAVPGQIAGTSGVLAVCDGSGNHRYSLLHVAVPDLVGSTVTSAILHVTLRDTGWRAGNKIKVDLLVNAFTEQSNWNNYQPKLPTLPTSHQVIHTNVHTSSGAHEAIDVTQLFIDAAQSSVFYGLLLSTDSIAGGHQLFSSESSITGNRPYLEIVYSQSPPAPTELVPAVGASALKPMLAWKSLNQVAFNVQISSVQNGSVPDYDTGWVASVTNGWDSASALTWSNPPADGFDTSWRVRTQNAAGATSAWSPWTTYTHRAYGVLSITDPVNNGDLVDASTPEIQWSLAGGTQSAWQVLLNDYDSLRNPGTDTSIQLPAGLVSAFGVTYLVEVRVWDSQVRDAPGEPGFVSRVRTFLYDNDGSATDPVETLTAVSDGPAVILSWTRTSEPDTFLVVANGTVRATIDPGDAAIGDGFSYRVRYLSAEPAIETTWEVRAHDDATGDSPGNPTAVVTFQPIGVWLSYAPLDIEVQMLGQANVEMKITEDGATFLPLGRQAPIRIVDQVRGYEGSAVGTLATVDDLNKFNAIKALDPGSDQVRLTFGTYNIPIELGEATVSQWPAGMGDQVAYDVTVEFWQTGPPWPADVVNTGWGEFAWGDSQWE